MKYQQLLSQSKKSLEVHPPNANEMVSIKLFELGAKWMFDKLNENKINKDVQFNCSINFSAYGLFKYGISFVAFFFSAFLFLRFNFLLLPLSIVIFYFAEVHFLFLFPILIDNIKNPIWTSIKQTYKTGIIKAMLTVIPIGLFMMFGIIKFKNPWRNWYIGCLAILIWYKNEVRTRI